MNDCIFCKIAKSEIPSTKRYEDKDFFAFDDINPKAKIHLLVIPKKHFGSISTLENDDFAIVGDLIKTAKTIADKEGIESFRLVFNNGSDAGMQVEHLHLHIMGGEKSKHIY